MLGLLVAVVGVLGGTMTWSGLGTNNLWNNAANWQPYGIPKISDDVVMSGVDVLVGSADGALASSITATNCRLEVRGCSMTADTLNLKGTVFTVNSGAGEVKIAKEATVDEKSELLWTSGSIGGVWTNAGKMTAGTIGGGVLQCAKGGTFANSGSMTFANATQLLFACPVTNTGGISFQHDASVSTAQFIVNEFQITETSTGSISVSGGPIEFKTVTFRNLALEDKAEATINLATADLKATSIGDGAKLSIHQSTVTMSSTKGTGTLEVDIGSTVTLSGSADLGSISVNAGHCVASEIVAFKSGSLSVYGGSGKFDFHGSKAELTTLRASQGSIAIESDSTVTAETVTVEDGDGFFTGGGVLKVQTLSIQHFAKLAVNVSVGKEATIGSNLAMDGSLTIPSGISLTIPGGSYPVWGPSNASLPGILNLEGVVIISGNASLTVNTVKFEAAGEFMLKGKLDIQATTFKTTNVTLADSSAVLQAEGATMNYGALAGSSGGVRITMYTDRGYSYCNSPCGGQNAFYQSYKAYIA